MNNIKISVNQIEIMRHAIGFSNYDSKKKKYEVYRNYYTTSAENQDWEELVAMGLAIKFDKDFKEFGGYICYLVSGKGFEFLSRIFNVKITD